MNFKTQVSIIVFFLTISIATGTAATEISDWHDLDDVRNDLSGDYILVNNLDSETDGYDDLVDTEDGWNPIGDSYNGFSGDFDGNNYVIDDLYINRPNEDYVGLFGYIQDDSVITNVGVVNVNITGSSSVGSIIGRNAARGGKLNNSYASGKVKGHGRRVGGLIGYNHQNIRNSYFKEGDIEGDNRLGGILGVNRLSTTVHNSYYNYDEVLINGENILTEGAIYEEDFNEWLDNDKYLDVNERLNEEDGYYLIENINDFEELLIFGINSSIDFRLDSNIDLNEKADLYIPYLGGKFNGNNNTISNLNVDLPKIRSVGLFGYTDSNVEIRDLNVQNADVVGYRGVAGLVGLHEGDEISNVYVSGSIESQSSNVGGLIGYNRYSGHISDVNTFVNISGGGWCTGGLIGRNRYGRIEDSYSSGEVTGSTYTGGLIGDNRGAEVSDSYSLNKVTGSTGIGGLLGRNREEAEIKDLYAFGDVDGHDEVGGLIGRNVDSSKVNNSYSTGYVKGEEDIGGLVGYNSEESEVFNSFWNTETSGQDESDGGTGKTTSEMKSLSTFQDADWDITEAGQDHDYTWNMIDEETYPFFPGPFARGAGTEDDPYEITSWHHLNNVRNNLNSHYKLISNLNETTDGYNEHASENANNGKGWDPLGQNHPGFNSVFDGRNNTISDLYIGRSGTDRVGLFSYNSGEIKNIGLKDVNITGNGYIGALIGQNYEKFYNSYATGSVKGDYRVGGLVGYNRYVRGEKGFFSNYFNGSVSGNSETGPLVGFNTDSYIYNSYYNYNKTLINGENKLTIGGIPDKDFNQWLNNDKHLDVDQRLEKHNEHYLIQNITDFKQLKIFGQNSTLKFSLQTDLDLQNHSNLYIPYLAGEFQGNNHEIKNLNIGLESMSYIGLFGFLYRDGYINQVNTRDVNITGNRYVGGLVGRSHGKTSNGYSDGYVKGSTFVGGLIGYDLFGEHYNDSSKVLVNGSSRVGGLIGNMYNTDLYNSHATGRVVGESSGIGGLVGRNLHDIIHNSYATGKVVGNSQTGGLLGYNQAGEVSNSYASGDVKAEEKVGGLVGENYDSSYGGRNTSTISDSYATGEVIGDTKVGGLVGANTETDGKSEILNSYSTGLVEGNEEVGGLVGDPGTETNSYWDTNTSNQTDSDGGTPLTTREMTEPLDEDEMWLGFDGYEDYVDLKSALIENEGKITFSGWAYFYEPTPSVDSLIRFDSPDGWQYIRRSGTSIQWRYQDIEGESRTLSLDWDIEDHDLTHITMIVDYDDDKVYGYEDGKLIDEKTAEYGFSRPETMRYLGSFGSPSHPHPGRLGDFRVYNYSLSENEIKILNETRYTDEVTNGLVGWWPMNESTGNTTYDYSGNENHGSIEGAEWARYKHAYTAWNFENTWESVKQEHENATEDGYPILQAISRKTQLQTQEIYVISFLNPSPSDGETTSSLKPRLAITPDHAHNQTMNVTFHHNETGEIETIQDVQSGSEVVTQWPYDLNEGEEGAWYVVAEDEEGNTIESSVNTFEVRELRGQQPVAAPGLETLAAITIFTLATLLIIHKALKNKDKGDEHG